MYSYVVAKLAVCSGDRVSGGMGASAVQRRSSLPPPWSYWSRHVSFSLWSLGSWCRGSGEGGNGFFEMWIWRGLLHVSWTAGKMGSNTAAVVFYVNLVKSPTSLMQSLKKLDYLVMRPDKVVLAWGGKSVDHIW